jgi:hypothetical protein
MSHPLVVHCKLSNFDIYIGRPSIYGNSFLIGKDGNRAEVVRKYLDWINLPEQEDYVQQIKRELRGKILGCWCAPLACHGDILAQIANKD